MGRIYTLCVLVLDTGDEQKGSNILENKKKCRKHREGRLVFEKPSVENPLSLSLLDGLYSIQLGTEP